MGSFKRVGPGLEVIEKALESFSKLSTQVGWFPGAKYEDGTPVAYIAIVQEYGSIKEGIPPRSFMRTTIEEKRKAWSKLAQSGSKAVLVGNATPIQVMTGLGLASSGDIKKKISEITSPSLKEATIKARQRKLSKGKKVGGLSKPLIESSLMITSLTSTVEKI